MKKLYTAQATTTNGREGGVVINESTLKFKLGKPGDPSTKNTDITNPEQLFASGYSACFGSAVAAVAKKEGVEASGIKVEAEVNLNQDDEGGYFLSVALDVNIPGVDSAVAQKLVEKAHHVCPYSKATRGNIEVTLKASGQEIKKAA